MIFLLRDREGVHRRTTPLLSGVVEPADIDREARVSAPKLRGLNGVLGCDSLEIAVTPTLTKVHEHPNFNLYTLRSLLVLLWKAPPTVASVVASSAVIDGLLSSRTGKVVFSSVALPGVALPDGPSRDALQQAIKRSEPKLCAAVNVILLTGFAAAAIRGVFTGFSLVVRPSYPLVFVGSIAEAASNIVRYWPATDAPTPAVSDVTVALQAVIPS